jgi:hypothetical protein
MIERQDVVYFLPLFIGHKCTVSLRQNYSELVFFIFVYIILSGALSCLFVNIPHILVLCN